MTKTEAASIIAQRLPELVRESPVNAAFTLEAILEPLAASPQPIPRAVVDAMVELWENDPHQFSSRPCSTCRTISGLLGRPYGCDKYRVRYNKQQG